MAKLIKFGLLLGALYLGASFLGINPFAKSGDAMAMRVLQEKARAKGLDKIVVLLTGTSWCPYCKDLDREVISKPEWDQFIGSEAIFASYEYGPVSRPKSGAKGEMLQRFDVEGFPTMVVLDRDGKVLDEMAGFHSGGLEYYKEWIESL